ncbi:MAG: hypothetical protein ACJ74O_13700 [Frankiaceae bacterium]
MGDRHGNAHLLAAVRVVQTRDAAIATVAIEGTEFAGTSKSAPGERHDPTSGGRLAIARALRAAADAYERAAGVTPYEPTVTVEIAPDLTALLAAQRVVDGLQQWTQDYRRRQSAEPASVWWARVLAAVRTARQPGEAVAAAASTDGAR